MKEYTISYNLLKAEIDRLRAENKKFRENIEYLLAHCGLTIRVCEGGRAEDIVQSLVVTFMKLEDKVRRLTEENKAEQKKSGDMFAQFCRFNLRMSAVAEDLNSYLLSDACEFAGKELAKGNKSS